MLSKKRAFLYGVLLVMITALVTFNVDIVLGDKVEI